MSNSDFDYRIYGDSNKAIIIETGIGNSYYDWIPLAEQLSESYKVILYHRCGYGLSKIINSNRTTKNIALELNQLVEQLGLERFILLSHSFGGLCAQHYALLYPNKVEKLVLIDSATTRLCEFDELDTPFINKHCSINRMIDLNTEISLKSDIEKIEMNSKSIARNEMLLSKLEMRNYNSFLASSDFYIIQK